MTTNKKGRAGWHQATPKTSNSICRSSREGHPMNDARFRSDAKTIAKELGGHRAGDQWMASCPAHEDENPSLSIKDAADGKVLVYCHAGCPQDAVISKLRAKDLWGRPNWATGPEQAEAAQKRNEEKHRKEVKAQSRITDILNRSKAADSSHSYLIKKKIKPNGLQMDGDQLVVPVRDIEGKLQSLHFISPNGDKKFHPNTSAKGGMYILGGVEGAEALCICTGFATGASIHEAVGLPVVVAFSDGNLGPVAEALRRKWPDLPMVVCADDDYTDPRNPGLTKAKEAAQAIKAEVAVPDFGSRRPKNIAAGKRSKEQGKDYSDFNDLQREWGLEAVKRQIEPIIKAANEPVYRPDPLEDLVARTEADPGAPFAPDVLEALVTLRQEDKGRFERLRAQLKRADIRVTELDKALDKKASDDSSSLKPADLLIELAQEATLFHSTDGTAFADLVVNGHHCETQPVQSKDFKRWLVLRFKEATDSAPNSEALKSALTVLEATGCRHGPEWEVHIRIGGRKDRKDKLYLDLGDKTGRAVKIDSDGWRVVNNPLVRFRRAAGMQALPVPESGGSIETLRRLLNVQSDNDFVLAVAWALAALRNQGPYPILVLSGEQGAAKSTFSAVLRALIDPNTAPLRALPREDRDLFITANNGHVLAFDNLSGLPAGISDTLCRIASGGGFSVRQLYTDQDEVLFNVARPMILNGIEDIVTRTDLADRAIFLTLEAIPEERRRPEKELWAEFNAARPQLLGTLLDAVSHGLKKLPNTRLDSLPRMADFALWATACETAFWKAGTFSAAYAGNRNKAVDSVIEADPVGSAIRSLISLETEWTGTASELLGALEEKVGEKVSKSKAWPRSAQALSGRVRRVATFLRKVGIDITFEREGHARKRIIRIICTPKLIQALLQEMPDDPVQALLQEMADDPELSSSSDPIREGLFY